MVIHIFTKATKLQSTQKAKNSRLKQLQAAIFASAMVFLGVTVCSFVPPCYGVCERKQADTFRVKGG